MKGIDCSLPAKDLTSTQWRGKGKIKHVFCLCKPLWLLVEQLVDVGHTSAKGIKKTNDIHPGSTTEKSRAMKKCEKLGGHWRLCLRGRGVGQPCDDLSCLALSNGHSLPSWRKKRSIDLFVATLDLLMLLCSLVKSFWGLLFFVKIARGVFSATLSH